MATSDESKPESRANQPDIPPDFNLEPDLVLGETGTDFELTIADLGAPPESSVPGFPTIDLDLVLDPPEPELVQAATRENIPTSAFPTVDLDLDLDIPSQETPSLESSPHLQSPNLALPTPAQAMPSPESGHDLPTPNLEGDQVEPLLDLDFSLEGADPAAVSGQTRAPRFDFAIPDLGDGQDAFDLGGDEDSPDAKPPTLPMPEITVGQGEDEAFGTGVDLEFPNLDLNADQNTTSAQSTNQSTQDSQEDDFSFPDLSLDQGIPALDFPTPGFEVSRSVSSSDSLTADSARLELELEGLLTGAGVTKALETSETPALDESYPEVGDPWLEAQSANAGQKAQQTDPQPLPTSNQSSYHSGSSSFDQSPPTEKSPSSYYGSPDVADGRSQPSTSSTLPDPERERLDAALTWENVVAAGVAVVALGTLVVVGVGQQIWKPGETLPNNASSQLSSPNQASPGETINQVPSSSLSVKNSPPNTQSQPAEKSPTTKPDDPSKPSGERPTSQSTGQSSQATAPSSPQPTTASGQTPVAVPFNTNSGSPASPSPSPSPGDSGAPTSPTASTPKPALFKDVSGKNWAYEFIATLAQQQMVSGTPDGRFEPNRSVTRAEFAALLSKAFDQQAKLPTVSYKDVKADYWGVSVINEATQTDFLKGYPDATFRPQARITRLEVLLALSNGLGLQTPAKPSEVVKVYQDRRKIPAWAIDSLAAATEAGLVVNYSNVKFLNPDAPATRSDATAMIYQALVNQGKVQPIASKYIVKKAK